MYFFILATLEHPLLPKALKSFGRSVADIFPWCNCCTIKFFTYSMMPHHICKIRHTPKLIRHPFTDAHRKHRARLVVLVKKTHLCSRKTNYRTPYLSFLSFPPQHPSLHTPVTTKEPFSASLTILLITPVTPPHNHRNSIHSNSSHVLVETGFSSIGLFPGASPEILHSFKRAAPHRKTGG